MRPVQRVVEAGGQLLSLERGGALCPAHGANHPGTIALPLPVLKVLRFLQTRPWEQVAQLQLTPAVGRQVKTVLARYIVYHLEHGLRSTVFMERLRHSLATADDRRSTIDDESQTTDG